MLPEKRVAEVESIGNSLKRIRPDSSVEVVNQDVNMAANGNCSDVNIDEDLHSRQLAVYGRDAMQRLSGANVLILGLQGLGCEIAKNVILAGVKSVTLHDSSDVEMWDLSGNFYLSESDIGKNRALACSSKLQELNTTVVVSTLTSELLEEDLANFQVVVVTSVSLEKAIEYDEFCRTQKPPIAFIKADIYGLFGGVFCDFGPEFTVVDIDGEEPHTGIIASISHESPALVSCVEEERLEFQDGDLVIFSEVQGMAKLNDGKPRKVKNVKAFSFMLEEDTTNFGIYTKGGIVTQVKEPKVLKFQSLSEALKSPGEFLLSDFSKFDRPPLLHIAFQALDKFIQQCGRFPLPASDEDASLLIELSRTINADSDDKKLDTLDENILKHLASGSRAVLNPMAAVFGGIAGQEIVKACSGKFHPLFQFFYFDSLESLPEKPLKVEELAPLNSRYDAQVSVFGREMQRKLENAKLFVVGAGALGCELLKNLALMGISCGNQGKLTVTDDDIIERSNLSRQFLFRDWNIGQAKSTVAASAATAVNADLRIEALQNRVCPATETVFDYAFWEGLDVILNALDNVNARLYVDSRCVYFQKPLLESGTLGTKCNTQMVIPHKTENYGGSRDPPEKQAPMCTVHSFPHNIDHCLTWARSEFEGLLEKIPAEANAFLSNPEEYKEAMRSSEDAQARDLLERVVECLVTERCTTFEDCVAWARNKFEDYFSNRVKQLTYTFPEDALTTAGMPFWSAPKRFPKPLKFNTNDPSHMSLLAAASILRATVFGIAIPDWTSKLEKLTKVVEKVQVLEFKPKQGVKIETDEKATNMKPSSIDDTAELSNLIKVLETGASKLPQGFRMNPIQFEKDDDTNYHMDLIAGLANMRARNYGIPEVDKLKAKFIAGRIIPAIATTTAMATGLVCLELYKVLLGHEVDKYRNTFANLALPFFAMAEPMPPKTVTYAKLTWSVWDRWAVEGNLTLQELINWFKAKDLSADIISCGQHLLYNSFIPGHNVRLDKRVLDLAKNIAKLELPPRSCHFDITVACQDNEEKEIDVPLISIYFQ